MLIARYLGRPELGLVNGLTYRLSGVTEYNDTNYCPVCGAVMKLVLK